MSALTQPICIYDASGLERLRRQHRLDPTAVRKLRTQLFKHYLPDAEVTSGFPAASELSLHALDVYQRVDSRVDGATKLLMRTRQGLLLETVILRIATGRTTLCVSSQVGCAASCEFCATGRMGIAHDLTAAEILDQVVRAGQLLAKERRTPKNIVFMGMGEPLHNEAFVSEALSKLTGPELFHHPPGNILVSSVGVSDALLRCVEQFPRVNFAVSLHSVRQDIRERLMPLARKYPLGELRSTLVEVNRLQEVPVMIEYLMLADVNDADTDAQELIAWLAGLNVHVNLIPYNPIDDAPRLISTAMEGCRSFAAMLKAAGLKTTIRYSLGSDIAAACGQLVRRENREIARQISRTQ